MTTGHPTSPGGQRPLAEAQSPVLPAPCVAGRARRADDEAPWVAHAFCCLGRSVTAIPPEVVVTAVPRQALPACRVRLLSSQRSRMSAY